MRWDGYLLEPVESVVRGHWPAYLSVGRFSDVYVLERSRKGLIDLAAKHLLGCMCIEEQGRPHHSCMTRNCLSLT
jgi:hypothetical protein